MSFLSQQGAQLPHFFEQARHILPGMSDEVLVGPKGIGDDRARAFDQVGVEQAEDIRSVQVCVPGDTPRQNEPHARTFDRSLGELTASSGDREAFEIISGVLGAATQRSITSGRTEDIGGAHHGAPCRCLDARARSSTTQDEGQRAEGCAGRVSRREEQRGAAVARLIFEAGDEHAFGEQIAHVRAVVSGHDRHRRWQMMNRF